MQHMYFCFTVKILTFLATLLPIGQATAMPAQVVIIRHAEKPLNGNEVNQQGCERAFSLPAFFINNAIVNQYGKPVALFAAQPDKVGGSLRPIETLAPTAQALGLPILDSATRVNYASMIQSILNSPQYKGATILISWEHNAIPGLAQALGASLTPNTSNWPGQVFDEAWVLSFHKKSGKRLVTLNIIPEAVLPGDNSKGGSSWGGGGAPIQGSVPTSIIQKCADNSALNAIAFSLANPPIVQ